MREAKSEVFEFRALGFKINKIRDCKLLLLLLYFDITKPISVSSYLSSRDKMISFTRLVTSA